MSVRHYKTDLRCQACVSTITPELDRLAGHGRWSVDLSSPDKTLTAALDPAPVGEVLQHAGYRLLGEVEVASDSRPVSYFPLALLMAFLLGGTAILQARTGFVPMQAMGDFMGLFFVTFAFFKLLDIRAFADAYASYDLIARRWHGWGSVYPLVELTLGVLYLLHVAPLAVNLVTFIVTSVGALGVTAALWGRRPIQCACLGTVFNLPMSWVSLTEDVGMALMAGLMLLMG